MRGMCGSMETYLQMRVARARNAVAGDEYLARHLGSFLVGDDLLK